jgi:hypothetical protein
MFMCELMTFVVLQTQSVESGPEEQTNPVKAGKMAATT